VVSGFKEIFVRKNLYIAWILIGTVLLWPAAAFCQGQMSVEGRDIEVKPIDGVDYISLNALSKKLGLSVKYFPESKMYKVIGKDKREIRFVVDKRAVVVGDTFIRANNPVIESDDDVKIPVEIISGLYSTSGAPKPAKTPAAKDEKPAGKTAEKPSDKPAGKTAEAAKTPLKPLPIDVEEEEEIAFEDEDEEGSVDAEGDTVETAVTEAALQKSDSHEATIENIKYRRGPDVFELDVAFKGAAPKGVKYSTGMDGKTVDIIINKVDSKLGEQLIKITENIVESVKLTMVNQENSNRVILSLASTSKVNISLKENGNMITFTVNKIDGAAAGELKPLIAEAASDTGSIGITAPKIADTAETAAKKAPGADVLKSIDKVEIKINNMDELVSGLGDIDHIIAIDAGHGGEEFGVVSDNRIKEKDVAFDIARRVKALMDKTKLRAILVRNGDYFMPLENRLKVINTYDTKLLVSIHAGGSSSPDASGIGIHYYDLGAQTASNAPLIASGTNVIESEVNEIMSALNSSVKIKESKRLAESIGESVRKQRELKIRNIRGANFAMLSECLMPAVIVEAGFITCREDEKALATDEFKDKIAAAVFEGVKKHILSAKKNN
jgi:N-acetylmuramoyl-L-alanine amidase